MATYQDKPWRSPLQGAKLCEDDLLAEYEGLLAEGKSHDEAVHWLCFRHRKQVGARLAEYAKTRKPADTAHHEEGF